MCPSVFFYLPFAFVRLIYSNQPFKIQNPKSNEQSHLSTSGRMDSPLHVIYTDRISSSH
mgnify:CR=1 FL=1